MRRCYRGRHMSERKISLHVNGSKKKVTVPEDAVLLDVLRDQLGLVYSGGAARVSAAPALCLLTARPRCPAYTLQSRRKARR